MVKGFWISISCVLLKNGRLDVLHDGNELLSVSANHLAGWMIWKWLYRKESSYVGWYICGACSVLVQKPVHQRTCHVVTFVFLEMHVMKVRCSDHNQYESHNPFVISGTVLHTSLIKVSSSFGKRGMFTQRCISDQPPCCLVVDSSIIYSFLFLIENIVTDSRFNFW